jgi:hypothetical protein
MARKMARNRAHSTSTASENVSPKRPPNSAISNTLCISVLLCAGAQAQLGNQLELGGSFRRLAGGRRLDQGDVLQI